jgi:hypothetical protein
MNIEMNKAFHLLMHEFGKAYMSVVDNGDAFKALCQYINRKAEDAVSETEQAYEEVLADKRRMTREIDVILNGEEGAATQASLTDIVAQLSTMKREGKL